MGRSELRERRGGRVSSEYGEMDARGEGIVKERLRFDELLYVLIPTHPNI